jgi:hypothetical protein
MPIIGSDILVHLIPLAGFIIGMISIANGRRKYTGRIQVDSTGSVAAGSLGERKPWLNNGFLAGLISGFAVGVGFSGPFVVISLKMLLFPGSSHYTSFALLVGIVLAVILGKMAKKAMIKRGLTSAGSDFTKSGIGRALLVIDGILVGLYFGLIIYVPLYIIAILFVL